MNTLRALLLSLAMLLCVTTSAGQSKKIIIVNGYFFNELPAAVKSSAVPQDLKISFIETPNGTKAICMYAPSLELSEESLRYAVPVENVNEGEELLRRYNEQKEQSTGISLTMGATQPLIKVGDTFPDFSATDITGKTWTNEDVKGKIMVLNLWFTGCGPCRSRQNPFQLDSACKRYAIQGIYRQQRLSPHHRCGQIR